MVMELQRRRLREPSAFLKEKYGVSIGELAEKTGLDRTTIHAIWVGRREPLYSTAQLIAVTLGIDLATLDAALVEFRAAAPEVYDVVR